jgi:hypothetical protein
MLPLTPPERRSVVNTLTITGLTSTITVNATEAGAGAVLNTDKHSASNLCKAGNGSLTLGGSRLKAGAILVSNLAANPNTLTNGE